MNDPKLVACVDVGNQLGESITWDPRLQCVWWTDIIGEALYSWSFALGLTQYKTPYPVCSFGLTTETNVLIVAFAKGFAQFNPSTQAVEWICQVESDQTNTRLNDGRVDRQGRFWSGSMDIKERNAIGSLYCLYQHEAEKRATGITISNGLCWNQAGDQIFHADSPTRVIKRAKFDAQSGQISDWQVFATTPRGAYPDGACVDAEGFLWSAQWGDACIRRYNTQGELVFTLQVPCKQPTCISFGGAKLDHLFVSSAQLGLTKEELKERPENGSMFVYKVPFVGIEESLCPRI